MPLEIIRNDITKMQVDAIVNAANETLLGGGGVDGAIHCSAGPELLAECRTLGGCKTGAAKLTKGYRLPAKYIIHTVGPVWHGGFFNEKRLLQSCYRSALELAKQHGCESVAFPLISAGVYGYPKDKALRVALGTITDFLTSNDMTVYLVIFNKEAYQISHKLFSSVQSFIDDHYVALWEDSPSVREARFYSLPLNFPAAEDDSYPKTVAPTLPPAPGPASVQEQAVPIKKRSAPLPQRAQPIAPSLSDPGHRTQIRTEPVPLAELLKVLDESFSEMLLRKIDEKGMSDPECYRKANISRKLFSKIRSDKLYKPSKPTVLAFAIALELSLPETRDILQKAGFALSRSNKFDVIVEYFIRNGNYDIYEINETLFAFDQSLLGA